MTLAERTAAPLLPDLAPRRADGPGQFAFADRQRVHGILDASGWTAVDMQAVQPYVQDAEVRFTGAGWLITAAAATAR